MISFLDEEAGFAILKSLVISIGTHTRKIQFIGYLCTSFCIAVLKKVRYALCPMPYALCLIVPHVTEKGYSVTNLSVIRR